MKNFFKNKIIEMNDNFIIVNINKDKFKRNIFMKDIKLKKYEKNLKFLEFNIKMKKIKIIDYNTKKILNEDEIDNMFNGVNYINAIIIKPLIFKKYNIIQIVEKFIILTIFIYTIFLIIFSKVQVNLIQNGLIIVLIGTVIDRIIAKLIKKKKLKHILNLCN